MMSKDVLHALPALAAPVGMVFIATRHRVVRHFTSVEATSPGAAIDYHAGNPLSTWWVKRLAAAGVLRLTDDGRRWLEPSRFAAYRQQRRTRALALLSVAFAVWAALWLADAAEVSAALQRSLAKLAIATGAIVLVVIVVRLRHLSLRDDLALRATSAASLAGWVVAHVGYMLLTNMVMHWRGPWDFTIWQQQGALVGTLRVLAVCVAGPIGEELIFRGLLYQRLSTTRLGPAVSVVVLAAVWAAIHLDVSLSVVVLFFGAGLLLGAARWKSGSVYVPIAMHIAWNLFAVW